VTGAADHWRNHERRLASLLDQHPFGLATDIDGTISKIASEGPSCVSPVVQGALAELAERCAVRALISGRTVPAIRTMIDLPGVEVFGIHGFQRLHDGRATLAPGVERWKDAIEDATLELRALARRSGAALETKVVTVVVDWRLCTDPGVIPELVLSVMAVAEARGLAVLRGRKSLEVHPPMDIDKGTCLTVLAQERHLRGLIYLGDDHSDITAFRAIRRMREEGRLEGLALGVMSAEMPDELIESADLVIDGVADVEQFFSWLREHARAGSQQPTNVPPR